MQRTAIYIVFALLVSLQIAGGAAYSFATSNGDDSLRIWIETNLHQDTLQIEGRFTGLIEGSVPLEYTLSVFLERNGGTSSSSQQGTILPGAFESKRLSKTSHSITSGDNARIILRLEKNGTFLKADTVYYSIR